MVGVGAEEVANVVGHVDEMLRVGGHRRSAFGVIALSIERDDGGAGSSWRWYQGFGRVCCGSAVARAVTRQESVSTWHRSWHRPMRDRCTAASDLAQRRRRSVPSMDVLLGSERTAMRRQAVGGRGAPPCVGTPSGAGAHRHASATVGGRERTAMHRQAVGGRLAPMRHRGSASASVGRLHVVMGVRAYAARRISAPATRS